MTEQAAEWVPIDKNPRRNEEAVKGVADSIRRFGFGAPILARRENSEIIAGHTRYLAAKQLGLDCVPVRFLNLDPADAHLLALADNKLGEAAEWDDEALRDLLKSYSLEDAGLAGWDTKELEALGAAPVGLLPGVDEDAVPEPPAEPKTKPGDLYVLGAHRLLCGDSTNVEHVERLLAGQRAAMLWTDPPYNAAFAGRSGNFDVIKNDDMSAEDFSSFIGAVASVIHAVAPAERYVCCRWEMLPELIPLLPGVRSCIVWAKNVFGMGRGYRRQHEMVLYAGSFDSTTESDLWECSRDAGRDYVHPTQKPVALVERALNNSSTAGDVVLDLFGGSGSTLIACEKLGRAARLMEIDPRYCDVVVRRFEEATGKKAELVRVADAA